MNKKLRSTLIASLFISFIISINYSQADQKKKKKLFVNNLTVKQGVPKSLAEKARDYITLSVFESYGRYYQIVTDEDIKVMYQKAELMMATGCDAENCVLQVADAINADEIIYGNITKEKNKLRFSVQNLERDSNTLSVSKKSLVNMAFFESKLEWYCNEIAKKLVNPKYNIDTRKAVSKITAKFDVEDIKIKEFEGINITKI